MKVRNTTWNGSVWLGSILLFLGLQNGALAQMTGIEIVVDTAFYGAGTPTADDTFDPAGVLDGYVSYLVYATFTNPTDVLSALYADTTVFEGSLPLAIDAPCGCWNPLTSSFAMDATNPSILWGLPGTETYQYDTFWTVGMLSSSDPGSLPSTLSNPPVPGSQICGTPITDGGLFVLSAPVNAVAGDDLKIEIARVTTCGNWSISANAQVFVNGDQSQAENFELSENGGVIDVIDPCQAYAVVEPQVTGLETSCAGLPTDVAVEYLGLADEATTYSLYSYPEGYSGDSTLVTQTATSQFPGLTQGQYRMLVQNEYGCLDTTDFEVVSPPAIQAGISLVDDNACFLEASALVELPDSTLSGGSGDLTVNVIGPDGSPVPNSIGPSGYFWGDLVCMEGNGQFVFTISDENGCAKMDTILVNCPEAIEATITSGDVICSGDADGFIVAEASGGSGSLYLTNQIETVNATDGLLDLSPGTYLVTVFDDFNCASPEELIVIDEPDPLDLSILNITNPSCGLDCDGSVSYTAEGGRGELEVEFFNTTTLELSLDSINLCAGDYVATLTDTAGCFFAVEFEVDAPAPLGFLIASTNATCTGMSDGSADIFPIGGTVSDQEYDMVVLDTAGNVANLNNLSEMTYTALVTDQLGCSYSETFSIGIENETDMELATFASPVTCWNAEDGTATVSVVGGKPPFTFEWSDPFGQTNATAVGLTEDTYTVVVTDVFGCRRSMSQSVEAIEGCLFIADALTPNDDGKNDEWVVGGLEDFPESEVMVFNRWGQRLFYTQGGQESWKGRFSGARLPVADYYYTISLYPGALPIRGTVTIKY